MAVAIFVFMVVDLGSVGMGGERSHRTNQSARAREGFIQETSKKQPSIARIRREVHPETQRAIRMSPVEVLLVEDDPSIASSLRDALESAGHVVTHVPTGAAAIEAPLGDIVLLDLGLPDMDGYDVCRRIRAASQVPIIVITARGEELDRVLGLELGADDYVVKPFGFRELVARMRAVTRRVGVPGTTGDSAAPDDVIEVGPLRIDRRAHRVNLQVDGAPQEISLTPKEYELLVFLAEDAGAVRTRTDIIEHVWDANWFGPTKTVDAHVAGIRRKLGDARWIEAIRGVGFRLELPVDAR
jgi:DNA-binding response OmpR family regulator